MSKKLVFILWMFVVLFSTFIPVVGAVTTNPKPPSIEKETDKYYNVTIIYNDGTEKSELRQKKVGTKYSQLPTPTRDKYDFLGWFTEQFGGKQVKNGDTFIATKNINLYAHWRRSNIEGKISYDDYDLYYYNSYFEHNSTEYDSHLATLSSYMTYFSMNLDASLGFIFRFSDNPKPLIP